ncbi:HNH endonuclease signature motif containing protein [Rhodococcoides corynebacterioides]|uniref:HNH endonuclease signature motif containing protein n=1 Tax=Rhodococcoides corynebacterioides TaxID=53972 RepID=UPI0009F94742|nr:HNH endonuclease signature motif containing protein [Rhodococcus corynebacterioides]
MTGVQVGTGAASTAATPWASLDHTALGLPVTTDLPSARALDALVHAAAGVAYLKWFEYQLAAAMHAELVEPFEDEDRRELDAFTRCAATIATTMSITPFAARTLLTDAVALRDRLPLVAQCLRDGIVTPHHIRTIVSRTELIEGQCYAALVDADIARALRKPGSWSPARMEIMVDTMVHRRDPDAVRARREAAKRNREFTVETGRDGMATTTDTRPAEDTALAAAAVHRLAAQVCPKDTRSKAARASDAHYALLTQTEFGCDCDRPITDCRYKNIDVGRFAATAPRIVIHLVTDTTTLTGPVPAPESDRVCRSPQHLPRPNTEPTPAAPPEGDAEVQPEPAANAVTAESVAPEPSTPDSVVSDPLVTEVVAAEAVTPDCTGTATLADAAADPTSTESPVVDESSEGPHGCDEPIGLDTVDGVGFLAGIGIISGAHVRDLATDPRTVIRPLGDGSDTPLPATQPSNPYRPSAALDAYVRARDQFCTWPGCNRPAWEADLDHITEYDHTHPERGGRTDATGLGAKCRFHHLLKTFGDFVDDQYPDPTDPSRLIRTITIPDGRTVLGPAFTGHDVHPGLDTIVFGDLPDTSTPRPPRPGLTERTRPAPRTEQKHARRRQERNRNRLRNLGLPATPAEAADYEPPPF